MLRQIFITGFISASLIFSFCNSAASKNSKAKKSSGFNKTADFEAKKISAQRALHYSDSIRKYLKRNGYSNRLLFVADMDLHMYVKRFYVIRPDSSKILNTFLVAHGKGLGSKWDSAVFSNVPGSLCSSKGKYKIGKSYFGEFGKGYKLHGIDATNNNAFKRLVVFHYYNTQTTEEYSRPSYMSSGCPMLAPANFKVCDSLIQKEKLPVMLVVY
ncbi:MAG: murein L,D-transpeptidase catalytic domain family protein [Bacteroidetes bacterium]|nr:murein L,D-transpeptidase catalytic domain family protein [Bacteroidota bacterium]